MVGELLHAKAAIDLGFHLLDDNTTLNIEYRNRRLQIVHPSMGYQIAEVSSLGWNTVNWNQLVGSALLDNPAAADDVSRLSDALNYLSMYEVGVSEMMTLLNIRQNLLQIGERKVLPVGPSRYLTNIFGSSQLASWSAGTVQLTAWS